MRAPQLRGPCFLRYTSSVTPEERIVELRRELAANPASRQFYQLGELLRRQGQLAEAAEVLRLGLGHHPRYVAAWVSLGRALLDLQQLGEARDAFRQALDLDPHNPVAWRLFGEAHLALGQRREALLAFEQALALVPGDEVLAEAVVSLKEELAAELPPQAPVVPAAAEPAVFSQPVPEQEPFAAPPPPPVVGEVFPLEAAPPSLPESEPVFGEPFVLPPPPPPGELPFEPETGQPLSLELAQGPALTQPPVSPEPVSVSAEPAPLEPPLPEPPPVFPQPVNPEIEEPQPAPPFAPAPSLSRPSLAEARAAVHRGDLHQAVQILEELLGFDPENQEAADLLALVRDMMEPLPPEEATLSPRERKIAALQRFLANVTLARERRGL